MSERIAVDISTGVTAVVTPQYPSDGSFVDAPSVILFHGFGNSLVVRGVEAVQNLRNACMAALRLPPEVKP